MLSALYNEKRCEYFSDTFSRYSKVIHSLYSSSPSVRILLVLDGATYSARKEGSCAPGLNELHLFLNVY